MIRRQIMLATVLAGTALSLVAGFATAGAASASSGAAASTTAGVPNPGGLMIRAPGASSLPTVSLNWSGYAATSPKKFNYVNTRFVQPAITCTGVPNQYTSNWAGLDGFNNGTVEQDGTFAWCTAKSGGTQAVYYAWYEMFPAGSVLVFRVHPGDVMNASVRYTGGKFVLTIADLTTGKTATDTAACASCERASAEWIIERPALCNNALTKCFLTQLADFHTTTMSNDFASLDGQAPRGIGGFANNYPIFIVNPLKSGGFISLDAVSALSGPKFSAVWERSGTKVPITLGPRS